MKMLICPELQDRVDFHMTRFRDAHDQVGRAWVTIDGEEVLDCSYYRRHMAVWKEQQAMLEKSSPKAGSKEYLRIHEAASEKADANYIFNEEFFRNAILAYPDISIGQALQSTNPLIKAFALIDRRLGKRTFEKIHLSENEHPLAAAFYKLRLEVFEPTVVSSN